MWATKSIVREVREQKLKTNEKFIKLESEQKDSLNSIMEVMKEMENRMNFLERTILEFQQSYESKYDLLLDKLDHMQNNLLLSTRTAIDDSKKKEIDQVNDIISMAKQQIVGELNSLQEHDISVTDSMATMNLVMQEMIQNIVTLDEGNRLILAKMLIKDIEI